MKVEFKVSDKVAICAEGENTLDIFAQLAQMQEVFQHSKCGLCGSELYRFVVRKATDGKKKEFNYYELHCQNPKCRARLAFGNSDNNVLYPKRKWNQLSDSEKEQRANEQAEAEASYGFLKNNGWYKWTAPPKENN